MLNQNVDINALSKTLIELCHTSKGKEIREFSEKHYPADIAEAMTLFEEDKYILIVLRLVTNDVAAEIFTYLDPTIQQDVVSRFSDQEIKELFDEIYTDDVVDIMEEMPANIVKKILRTSSKEDRAKINQILQYDDDTAGSIMSVEYIKLRTDITCEEAMEKIRNLKDVADETDSFYVVDQFNNLKGFVELKDIVFAKENSKVADVMDEKIITAHTAADQEEIANSFKKYDIKTLPVVNSQNKLVGIITVDDIIDVIEEEATEDIHKMAGISPTEESYFKTSVWKMVRSRSVWLLFLMVSATLSQIVISIFMTIYGVDSGDGPLNTNNITYIVTMLLTPLLTVISGTAGNAGSQSSTMVVRALSLREVTTKDLARVMWKELRVASITGLILIAANFVRMIIIYAVQFQGDFSDPNRWYAIGTISISMYLTLMTSKLIGGMLPILAKKVKLDPAVMAAPLLTTLVDAMSTAIFFSVGLIFYAPLIG